MPKVKWEDDLDTETIDNAGSEYEVYNGKIPPSGIYRFKLRWSKKGLSEKKKPKLLSMLVIDGSYKAEHKQYDGCPFWDHMPVQKSTAFRVKAFCDALNVTSAEFLNKMVVDDEGYVQKIGKLKVADQDLLVFLKVSRRAADEEQGFEERLEFGKRGGYLPYKEEEEDEADETADADEDSDSDSDEDDDDTPF